MRRIQKILAFKNIKQINELLETGDWYFDHSVGDNKYALLIKYRNDENRDRPEQADQYGATPTLMGRY